MSNTGGGDGQPLVEEEGSGGGESGRGEMGRLGCEGGERAGRGEPMIVEGGRRVDMCGDVVERREGDEERSDTIVPPTNTACIFPNCKRMDKSLTTAGSQRIRSIIAASKARGDALHLTLEAELDRDTKCTIVCHRDCVNTYTSKHHIGRHLKKRGPADERSQSAPPIRKRRSEIHAFEFKMHCIFCGELCLPRDKKNPSRWRTVVQCRTTDTPRGESLKTKIMCICHERGDEQAAAVRMRVLSATSDLPAADAQYHRDCYLKFMPEKNVQATQSTLNSSYDDDEHFMNLVDAMNSDPSHIWTSVELHDNYNDKDNVSRRELVSKLKTYFGESLVTLDISGCASLFCFKTHLPGNLRLVTADDSEESVMVGKLKKKIVSECHTLPRFTDYDIGQFRKSKTIASTSPTLLSFVASMVSHGEVTRASITLAQSIQAHITKSYNQTTLGLAVKLHHRFGSRELVSLLHQSGITVSYDEVLRFRTSVAVYTGKQPYTLRGLNENGGELASWVDNYDLNIFTPNGCRETHALAVEVTQQPLIGVDGFVEAETPQPTIPRLSKTGVDNAKLSEISPIVIKRYEGPKKPLPPATDNHFGLPYHVVAQRLGDINKTLNADIQWLTNMGTAGEDDDPPAEWSGYMNQLARTNGFVSKATSYIYGPLIDAPPSHPDTVLSSILYIEEFMKSHGQKYIHIVADLQLFKVAIQIKWSDPVRWKDLLVRPGGMHTLMSFLGCIGTLMKGSGLEEILSVAYKGLSNMLNGKAWPKALRGYRMVVGGLLKDCILSGNITHNAIEAVLMSARSSKTSRLWIDCFIYPVAIAHMFVRAEREGNYIMHMHCMTKMLPYFFAAGHWNYARYITYHLAEFLTQVDDEALAPFYMGHHVCRHIDGCWNGVFADQFGEQTYIRYGKAKGGLVGLTLSPDQMARWVLSYHVCNTVSQAMDDMFQDREDDEFDTKTNRHKEEGYSRKKLDQADRTKISNELKRYPHPLEQPDSDMLLNVVNGRVADDTVNVQDALAIGESMVADFKKALPTGFYNPIHSKVVTMEAMKKGVRVGAGTVYDMEKLYGRLLVLSQKRDVSLESMLCFELAPLPPAIFDDYGSMRKGTKSPFLHKLAVWTDEASAPDVQVIDGNEILYQISWPKTGTVRHLHHNFIRAVAKDHRVIVVFDRYIEGSTKTHERLRRTGSIVCPTVNLTLETTLPARDTIMKSSHNKRSLIKVFCTEKTSEKLTMVGEDSVYKHEEADCIIISYVMSLVRQKYQHIQVVSDDTDVFVLLVFFCWKWQCTAQLTMKKSDGRIIDINASAIQLGPKSAQLLATHALTGCDTVSYLFGKGKLSAVAIMMKIDVGLELIGERTSHMDEITTAGHRFIGRMYKDKQTHTSMNQLRHTMFMSKRDTPKIKTLPPTDYALNEHIKRAHLQTMIWKAADQREPPNVDISLYGWVVTNGVPIPSTGVSEVAPPELMKVVACGCSAQNACSRSTCSCHGAAVSCTSFCKCMSSESCNNPHKKADGTDSDSDNEDDGHE